MLFNSLPFLALVLVTFFAYYLPSLRNYQVSILILSSFVFYAYGQPLLLVLLVFSAFVTSCCSYYARHASRSMAKRLWATSGVVLNLSVLAFFKYSKLLAETVLNEISSADGASHFFLTIVLPIGISFYTFQGISLMIDTFQHREKYSDNQGDTPGKLTTHTRNTFLYICFFPQLVAGPIVRSGQFMPQIQRKYFRDINWTFIAHCLITGYFLKMVVADNLQAQTFWISYPYFEHRSSIDLVVLVFGYSMQIFADFAGYSLIAIGVAALFGYWLPKNFNFPYIAQSFSEFWKRWHISLSSWLKEYLYIPLGGNRLGSPRLYLNLLVVMLLGGLWHGAAWSYAMWGLWHGFALAIERPFLGTRFFTATSLPLTLMRASLVFVFVSFSWLLFKLPEFQHVVMYLKALVNNTGLVPNQTTWVIVLFYSTPVIVYHGLYLAKRRSIAFQDSVRNKLCGFMLAMIVLNSGNQNAFIYFQF